MFPLILSVLKGTIIGGIIRIRGNIPRSWDTFSATGIMNSSYESRGSCC